MERVLKTDLNTFIIQIFTNPNFVKFRIVNADIALFIIFNRKKTYMMMLETNYANRTVPLKSSNNFSRRNPKNKNL
jgi:hypothetical protein